MNSARDYIAWSLLTAGLLAAVGGVVGIALRKFGVLDSLHASRGRRLQRRLDRRLARGKDNYFEELRSIETAIAEHRASAIPAGPPRFKAANDALFVLYMFLFGFVLVEWLGQPLGGIEAPSWSHRLGTLWMPIFGLQYLLQSMASGARNALTSRIFGLCLLVLGTGIVIMDVVHPLIGTGA